MEVRGDGLIYVEGNGASPLSLALLDGRKGALIKYAWKKPAKLLLLLLSLLGSWKRESWRQVEEGEGPFFPHFVSALVFRYTRYVKSNPTKKGKRSITTLNPPFFKLQQNVIGKEHLPSSIVRQGLVFPGGEIGTLTLNFLRLRGDRRAFFCLPRFLPCSSIPETQGERETQKTRRSRPFTARLEKRT